MTRRGRSAVGWIRLRIAAREIRLTGRSAV